jgi:hypothetical protein
MLFALALLMPEAQQVIIGLFVFNFERLAINTFKGTLIDPFM